MNKNREGGDKGGLFHFNFAPPRDTRFWCFFLLKTAFYAK